MLKRVLWMCSRENSATVLQKDGGRIRGYALPTGGTEKDNAEIGGSCPLEENHL